MTSLVESVLQKMSSLKKPQRVFISLLLSTLIVVQGKANFRNMSRYCDSNEKRFSRWYRRDFDFILFNELIIFDNLLENTPCIAAMDASFMHKSGHKTEGLGKFYHGAISKAVKGLELSLISIVDMQSNTAYGLDAKQTIDVEPKEEKETEKKETAISRVDLYAEQAVNSIPFLLKHHIRYMAVDAYYTKLKFVTPVTEAGIYVVGKLRTDANLVWLYTGVQSGRGRPKQYDGKVKFEKELQRFDYIDTIDEDAEVYSAIVYCKCLKQNIRVVMLLCKHKDKVSHTLLFSSDTQLDAMSVLRIYKARFQIEFVFRDAKQFTGLMDCQARNKEAIHTHINASFSALNALKFEDANAKDDTEETVISIATWKRRKFNQHLINIIFDKLGIDLSDEKVSEVYDEVSEYGAIAA